MPYAEKIVRIHTLKHGQPRAYADSVYEAFITYERGDGRRWTPPKDDVLVHARVFIHPFVGEKKDQINPFQCYLDECVQLGPNKWRVRIIAPFTD